MPKVVVSEGHPMPVIKFTPDCSQMERLAEWALTTALLSLDNTIDLVINV